MDCRSIRRLIGSEAATERKRSLDGLGRADCAAAKECRSARLTPSYPARIVYRVSATRNAKKRANHHADELAQLEYAHIDSLANIPRGIPNLERQVAESPTLYFQALAIAYLREDFGQDPPGWLIEDQEQAARVLRASRHLLSKMRRLPGTGSDGRVDPDTLVAWVVEVRRLCKKHDRSRIGDELLGQFLSRIRPRDNDSVPSRPVCEVLERTTSADMALGYRIGIRNARDAHFRPDTGEPERHLATKYQDVSKLLQFEYPFVSQVFLELSEEYAHDADWHDAQGAARKRIW